MNCFTKLKNPFKVRFFTFVDVVFGTFFAKHWFQIFQVYLFFSHESDDLFDSWALGAAGDNSFVCRNKVEIGNKKF